MIQSLRDWASIGGGKTVTPRQAAAISLGGLGAGAIVVVLACTLFLVPFGEAMICYAIGGYIETVHASQL